MNIIGYAIAHSRVVLGVLIFIISAGTASYISIPKEAAPDVNIPIIYISLSQKGISPEAKFVKYLDKLDMALMAKIYAESDNLDLSEFILFL